jgi:hypothetical protein
MSALARASSLPARRSQLPSICAVAAVGDHRSRRTTSPLGTHRGGRSMLSVAAAPSHISPPLCKAGYAALIWQSPVRWEGADNLPSQALIELEAGVGCHSRPRIRYCYLCGALLMFNERRDQQSVRQSSSLKVRTPVRRPALGSGTKHQPGALPPLQDAISRHRTSLATVPPSPINPQAAIQLSANG